MVGLLDLVSSPIRIYVFGNLSLARFCFLQEQSPPRFVEDEKNRLTELNGFKRTSNNSVL